MWAFLIRLIVSYAAAHPDKVEQLIDHGVTAAIHAVAKHNTEQTVVVVDAP